jgi:anti-sigma regulatory factor (Ser/Thr protein kinase)
MLWNFHAVEAKRALRLRASFGAFLHDSCTSDSDFDGAKIVLGELVANVVRHAPGPIDISLRNDDNAIILDVSDTGRGFEMAPSLPPLSSESGRGLYLVSHLCKTVSVIHHNGRTTVSAQLPVTPLSPVAVLSHN